MLAHYGLDAVEHICGHAGIDLARGADEARLLREIAHEEPRVDGYAVSADAGTGLEDVDARVLVCDADDLAHVHAAAAAYLRQLVGEGNVDVAEGVLHDLGHLGGLYIGYDNVALAE